MTIEMTCPTCGFDDISKNGTSHQGKQNYKCRDCGRQFLEDPQWRPKPGCSRWRRTDFTPHFGLMVAFSRQAILPNLIATLAQLVICLMLVVRWKPYRPAA